jgi:hypothetical protein
MNDKDISKKKFKNLVKLSNYSNINLFKKNKKDWVLRDKRIIVDECKKMKKKMVKKLSTNLKNLTLEENIKLEKVKQYQISTISELDNLDTIINILTYSENDIENYIEVYEN